jgi:hypothetical protein
MKIMFQKIWSVVMRRFRDGFSEIQRLVATTGISGKWIKRNNQKQYRTSSGGIMNYWESTGTVNFQGSPDSAQKLESAMFPAETEDATETRAHSIVSRTTTDDADLHALTNAIIRRRVGPIFDKESAFIGKVARQCMLDLCEKLGLSSDKIGSRSGVA